MDKRYQIFISSTFADLEEERKEVMEAIINLDCFPAGMEMFPAADIEQFEYIKKIIDQSDYYVLVIAGRYGSVAEDGISYTEKEYIYAKEKGIPVLVFVKKDIDNLPVNKTDNNPELRAKLDEFRDKAMNNRLAKLWNESLELKYNVHDSLTKSFKSSPRTGWVKGDNVADVETLKKLEELRVENAKLTSENSELRAEINKKEEIKNIAQGDDEFIIRYSYRSELRGFERNGESSISWNKLFELIGPEFIVSQSIYNAIEIVENAIKRFDKTRIYSLSINKDDFNTIKLQLDALNLITCFVSQKVGGGVAEFMQLTKHGKEYLKRLKVQVKKEEN